jgi:hypothetical protein
MGLLVALLLPALTSPMPVLATIATLVACDGVAAAPGVAAITVASAT